MIEYLAYWKTMDLDLPVIAKDFFSENQLTALSRPCGNIHCSYQHYQPGKITLQVSVLMQGFSEGTSSVASKVLIISCRIYFTNLFIFNMFDIKFLFYEKHVFRKQKRTAVYGRSFLVSDFKLTRENDDHVIFKT